MYSLLSCNIIWADRIDFFMKEFNFKNKNTDTALQWNFAPFLAMMEHQILLHYAWNDTRHIYVPYHPVLCSWWVPWPCQCGLWKMALVMLTHPWHPPNHCSEGLILIVGVRGFHLQFWLPLWSHGVPMREGYFCLCLSGKVIFIYSGCINHPISQEFIDSYIET